jgi:hypothetical protein
LWLVLFNGDGDSSTSLSSSRLNLLLFGQSNLLLISFSLCFWWWCSAVQPRSLFCVSFFFNGGGAAQPLSLLLSVLWLAQFLFCLVFGCFVLCLVVSTVVVQLSPFSSSFWSASDYMLCLVFVTVYGGAAQPSSSCSVWSASDFLLGLVFLHRMVVPQPRLLIYRCLVSPTSFLLCLCLCLCLCFFNGGVQLNLLFYRKSHFFSASSFYIIRRSVSGRKYFSCFSSRDIHFSGRGLRAA